MKLSECVAFDSDGLIPAIIQHHQTGQVLMLGYMNRESLDATIDGGRVCFWSRSRQEFWRKGDTSGNYLHVKEIRLDCDGDTLLLKCAPDGPTCHTGETSCFYRKVEKDHDISLAGDGVATK